MRLIDADAIPYRDYLGDDEPRVYKSQIDAMSTIDAAPVVHGRWIDRDTVDDDGNKDVECSECGHGDKQRPGLAVPYCWFCGCKMDKEE